MRRGRLHVTAARDYDVGEEPASAFFSLTLLVARYVFGFAVGWPSGFYVNVYLGWCCIEVYWDGQRRWEEEPG